MYNGATMNNGKLHMKIMNRCAKAQCAAAGGKKIDGLDHANVDPAGGALWAGADRLCGTGGGSDAIDKRPA